MQPNLNTVGSGDRIGVIGAGPAGLAAAYALTKLGIPVDVFEAAPVVGGMARTIDLWGQRVDLGPHRFFSADARVNRFWLEVVGSEYRMVHRLTRIHYNGKFIAYPLTLWDSLGKLGPIEAFRCLASYARELFRCRGLPQTFQEWVCGRFGKRLYETFFRSYSEKLWGLPCSRLDADFAVQRIRKFSIYEALKNALFKSGAKAHATLVDVFAYPLGGTGSVYSAMAERVIEGGGSVYLNAPVRRVVPCADGEMALELFSGAVHRYRRIISSMPLTHLVKALPDAPEDVLEAASALRFRNTILIYLQVAEQEVFPDQWIYVHDSELEVGRITNFRNWVPELNGNCPETILALEIWCSPGDETWLRTDEQHIECATANLRQMALVGNARINAGHVVRIPNCYPVYDLGYRDRIATLRNYLKQIPGIQVIGRGGAFRYNNQDHSLLMGILAAENIARGTDHDLWSVNTEEVYQEAAYIDETGLVRQAR